MQFAANWAKMKKERWMERHIREEIKYVKELAKEKGWKQKPPHAPPPKKPKLYVD
jgi:hypothetical protein